MPDIEFDNDLSIEELEALEAADLEQHRIEDAVKAIVQRLDREAESLVGKKSDVEAQWYLDTRQYYGRYDAATEANLKEGKKSRLFVHLTRPKTDTWIARLFDLLFPTDEKNWAIQPTPVPEIQTAIDASPKLIEGDTPTPEQTAQLEKSQAAKDFMEVAKVASIGMSREIDDQLTQARYAAACRDVIEHGCKLGTGILKGPVDGGKNSRKWVKRELEDGTSQHELTDVSNNQPDFSATDPWNFFPDPSATDIADAEFTYERHLWTHKKLRKMARVMGLDEKAVRSLLEEGPTTSIPNYISQIRDIARQAGVAVENRFVVWEYRGPLTAEEVHELFVLADDMDGWETLDQTPDPLLDIDVVVYFCQGQLLKFGIHHLDSGEPIYSVFTFAKDTSSIWGWGVPALMRDSQAAINAAWRMMLDNGGLSTGPQVLVNQKAVTPADGNWEITARKVWKMKDDAPNGISPFQVFNIDSNQSELANIIKIGKEFADEEVSLPAPMQGEQGGQVANTYGGLAILMNSGNVIFRRVVKNFDDDLTVPTLRRLYDWNMQFSDKEEIKGDMQVDARGSSVLLVRELQSQNLIMLLEMAAKDPELSVRIKKDEALRKAVESMMLSAKDLLRNDDEVEKFIAENMPAEGEEPQVSPEELRLQIAQIEANSRLEIANINRETEMIRYAAQSDMKFEELEAQLQMKQIEVASKERIMAGEAGFKMKLAKDAAAGTAIEQPGTRYGGAT